eukprot:CAMPEP_0194051976 /NCGR_PEP_ID=MMETSP0009_2-20130614/43320_1 /TAXON_ID=210454 /ORGANISM="Grammatophora oceanica, Strain CCMP 410" /LENGTH=93 /DNA_ID=CAMNT_0038699333 /DNA_START=174 /DNA_END=453 /DNA_ORIENTATION=+
MADFSWLDPSSMILMDVAADQNEAIVQFGFQNKSDVVESAAWNDPKVSVRIGRSSSASEASSRSDKSSPDKVQCSSSFVRAWDVFSTTLEPPW